VSRFAIAILLFAGAPWVGACGSEDGEAAPASGGSTSTGGAAGAAGQPSGGGAGAPAGGNAGSSGNAGSDAGGTAGDSGAAGGDAGTPVDADGDGLDDATERAVAESYYPYYSIAPADKCPLHGVLFRATPHPEDSSKIALWYVVLFEKDCGTGGHVGDDEVFGALVDPKLPAPAGLLALRAISHQGTLCEQKTTCGTVPGCSPCASANKNGKPTFIVFPSVNKHGNYVDEGKCDLSIVCDFGGCTLNPNPDTPPFENAGEPGKPLTNDLTASGFITSANGWSEATLMGFDPWGSVDFGGAGSVADDLVDPAFLISPSGC